MRSQFWLASVGTGRVALVREILQWSEARSGCDIHALTGYLSARLNRRLSFGEVEEALNSLASRELIERHGERVWLCEPDRRELDLYDAIEGHLKSSELLEQLGVQGSRFVFQKTALGGPRGDGPLTRPDFTLAVIQCWKFDPVRTLGVFSFEVKNRAGATIAAVYEAVAHGRLVHYPYLVCPRSDLNESVNEEIRTACSREGVGLIWFNICVPSNGRFNIPGVELAEKAERRSPDPLLIQRHLESRFSPQNCASLIELARGGSG
jgi:hypothetical protein